MSQNQFGMATLPAFSRRCFALLFFLILGALSMPAFAAKGTTELQALKEMSIEGLLDIEITSVSKKAQKLWGSAAAIHVINQEDIRRSGATSIPEVLRLAPGISVAKVNANSWAITSRGFNGRFSNKLLVLIDGRSVYTPLYSGVYWDAQDTILADIERIEIVRGPGATIWGANAVNGVINIITKNTRDTQGGHFQARFGDEEEAAGEFRYGAALDRASSYRVYGKTFKRDGSVSLNNKDASDDWDGKQAGFRLDSELTPRDSIRIQGDLYNGDSGQTITLRAGDLVDEVERSGGNLLFSWEHILSENSGLNLLLFYDNTERTDAVTSEKRDTYDIDFNHYFDLSERNHINWGLGYKRSKDQLKEIRGSSVNLDPRRRSLETWSGFIQDKITIMEDELTATLGTKIEHNSYTGWEVQPSARLSWTPNESLTAWGAISGAVRNPSRVESDFNLLIPSFPVSNSVMGNDDLDSEKLTAFEFGLRKKFSNELIMDMAVFYNHYKELRTIETLGTTAPNTAPYFLPAFGPLWLVNEFSNEMTGNSYGLEITGDWQLLPSWKLKGSYSWLKVDLDLKSTSTDIVSLPIEGYSPEHQIKLQSLWNLTHNIEFDTSVYYNSRLEDIPVPSYTRVDLRLGWLPQKSIAASLVLQNILDNNHPEFNVDEGILPRNVERGIYGQITWTFK